MKAIAILLISLLSLSASSCGGDTSNSKTGSESLPDNSDNYYTYNASDNSDNSEIDDPEISKYYDLWVDDANDSEDASGGLKSESDAASTAKGSDSDAAQAPAPPSAQAPSAAAQGETVYVTPSGKKYHKANCRTMRKNAQATDLNDAISKGYEPCSICSR